MGVYLSTIPRKKLLFSEDYTIVVLLRNDSLEWMTTTILLYTVNNLKVIPWTHHVPLKPSKSPTVGHKGPVCLVLPGLTQQD